MRGEEHYGVLGLRPGANRAEVDEAYRRLIKLHHPDRMGGDASRAAEINRAYTQLRRQLPVPVQQRRVPVPLQPPPRRGRPAFPLLAAVMLAAAAVFAFQPPPRASLDLGGLEVPWPRVDPPMGEGGAPAVDFDEPLHEALIDRSIADAVQFHQAGNAAATLDFSRSCHNSLRDQPSLARFDYCAAFDEATGVLNSNDALAEGGPFSASAVVARHIGAARSLSGDMLIADSRIHEIRTRVELALIPRMDEAAVAAIPAGR